MRMVCLLLAVSACAQTPRFYREWWYKPGIENGNPGKNPRFRVNSPEVVLHPTFGQRPEVKSSGMMHILVDENLAALSGAELYLELWGGHPGTANKRVTPNGRTMYPIPETGTAARHCTHQYPSIMLKLTDLVQGFNAFQFACDKGDSFWGHYIVENACVRAAPKNAPDFRAAVRVERAGEKLKLALEASGPSLVTSVDYQGYYAGYNENGAVEPATWHGYTKAREPQAWLGHAIAAPFAAEWDTGMLPAQRDAAVRAVVRLRDGLVYETAPVRNLEAGVAGVRVLAPVKLPAPFWSRANRRQTCEIVLEGEPAAIERAELHTVVWDGGRGNVANYFTLNGVPFEVAGKGRHDVIYTRLPVDPKLLRRGANRIEVLSGTEHHGIEVLAPGPALIVRMK